MNKLLSITSRLSQTAAGNDEEKAHAGLEKLKRLAKNATDEVARAEKLMKAKKYKQVLYIIDDWSETLDAEYANED